MMIIKCSVCNAEEDMRELTSPWFEDGEHDICPDCFGLFKEENDKLVDEYKERKRDLFQELRELIKPPEEPSVTNVISLVSKGDKDEG